MSEFSAEQRSARDRRAREGDELRSGEPCIQLAFVEVGENELPCRRGVEWDVGVYPVCDADVTRRVDLEGDAEARPSVRHGQQRRLPRRVSNALERRLRGFEEPSV